MILNKYNEVMGRVTVSEETKQRILENLQTAQPESAKIVRFPHAKRYIAVAACFAVALIGVLAVTLFGRPPQIGPDPATDGISTGGYAAEYRSAKALSRASGVKIKDLKHLPFTPTETRYLDYGIDLAEIVYADEAHTLYYRASEGSPDPSGDYNEYDTVETRELGGVAVTLRGSGGLIYVALYEQNGVYYSIGSPEGLTPGQLEAMLP